MENLSRLTECIFKNTINPGFCLKVIQQGDDPVVQYVIGNNEFEKLSGGKAGEYKEKDIQLSTFSHFNDTIKNIIKEVINNSERITKETEGIVAGKTFKVKA